MSPWSGATLRAACARVLDHSPWVRLDPEATRRFAASAPARLLTRPAWDDPGMLDDAPERVLAWLLAYNAVNFCYWPDRGPRWSCVVDGRPMGVDDEALGVMGALAAAIRRGVPLEDGRWLAELEGATLEAILAPAPEAGPLPGMPERLAGLRELGRAYQAWGGPLGWLSAAGGSAPALVDRLVVACPLWGDDRGSPTGEVIAFRKRAQLCVAMVAERLGGVTGLDALTAFADYRLPQVLRGVGIVRLAPSLADRIDRGEPIYAGSAEEVALRAGAVVGADLLVSALRDRAPTIDVLAVDYLLWRTAVERQGTLPAFHRTRTTAY